MRDVLAEKTRKINFLPCFIFVNYIFLVYLSTNSVY